MSSVYSQKATDFINNALRQECAFATIHTWLDYPGAYQDRFNGYFGPAVSERLYFNDYKISWEAPQPYKKIHLVVWCSDETYMLATPPTFVLRTGDVVMFDAQELLRIL